MTILRVWVASAIRVCLLLALGWVVMVATLTIGQRQLIYQPMTASLVSLQVFAQQVGMTPWSPEAGTPPRGWISPSSQNGVGLMLLHGNAGFALHRASVVQRFQQVPGIGSALILEYPGYGARLKDQPSESQIIREAAVALEYWSHETGGPVLLAGESLGSALAVLAAAQSPRHVRGLLLITPMNRLPDVAAHHFPWLPVRWMLREQMDAEAALPRLHHPVALVIAGNDEVVPAALGRRLAQVAPGPVRIWNLTHEGHNTLSYLPKSEPWDEAITFLLDSLPP